jgi:predicted phosphoadenosine phosphosulfate sulfurtransferase
MNVLEAAKQRIDYVFSKFEHVYVAFSGGKDSGAMLHLVYDHLRSPRGRGKRCTVVFIDLEGFYRRTVDFAQQLMLENRHLAEPMWICLPMRSWNTVSMHEPWWWFWDSTKQDKWVRPMPTGDHVITSVNNPFGSFWHDDITFEQFCDEFGDWLAQREGCAVAALVGTRTQESLNRWRSIYREDKGVFENCRYSVVKSDQCVNFYPIHDWLVEDIWTYYARFEKPYNSIYDLFYKAGVPLSKMRICEPFGDEQKAGLNLFKVIEPETWVRLIDRVSGVNFGNIYCGTTALGMRNAVLPPGHTWRSYCKFLLKTLPNDTRKIYMSRFVAFIKWWHRKGSPTMGEHIRALPADLIYNTMQYSNRGAGNKHVVRFRRIADELRGLDTKSDFPTWKRMCMTILRNDITCKGLHFGLTKYDMERRKSALKKYGNM